MPVSPQIGILLNGLEIDSLVVGGPAFESKLLEKGDIILQIDKSSVSLDDIQQRLVGTDVPGSSIMLTIRKKSGRTIDVALKKIPASIIADQFRMLEMFAICKVKILLFDFLASF